ncbi:hypothetical protein [Mesorhizobium sp. M0510]|uniref:hypothetical protein n=1 Tax=unclassified Mesorhizobium TaxID=325217 RepID=UPI0033370438
MSLVRVQRGRTSKGAEASRIQSLVNDRTGDFILEDADKLARHRGAEFSYTRQAGFRNFVPARLINTIDDLRNAMTRETASGAAFVDYLLDGPYQSGKGVWINRRSEIIDFYRRLISQCPDLESECPYGEYYRTSNVRTRGDNKVTLKSIQDAPVNHQQAIVEHRHNRTLGRQRPVVMFAGGPAAKIAAIITSMATADGAKRYEVKFALDGAEQSNESGSASYEHINHANALNAEQDNTGLGILFSAVKRALLGEADPAVALSVDYKKVDLWPRAVAARDIPIYLSNEFHGRLQTIKAMLGLQNDHVKSRLASKASSDILSYLEQCLGCSFRLPNEVRRAIFLYFTQSHFRHSLKDNAALETEVGLRPQALSAEDLTRLYGASILKKIVAADLFPENACIRHGFDAICRGILVRHDAEYLHRRAIRHIYLENVGDTTKAVAVVVESLVTGEQKCLPVDHLALSLGPTATFHYGDNPGLANRTLDRMKIGLPIPYQTIAAGFSAQVLFRITDPVKADNIPFTGMKQTHFVEIGRTTTHVLMKVTCGGVIGLPVYSRSYGLSALASLLRTITPDMGLQFEDVVCAWPCTRAVNASNNGQIVQIAQNSVVRFGEGGTGMSKMATNAQTMIDLLGLDWPLPSNLRIPRGLYEHTIISRARRIKSRLFKSR